MSIQTYPKREWIAAGQSFDGQSQALVEMVDRLDQQIGELAPARPNHVAIVGIGASHAAAGSACFQMRKDGIQAVRFLASELPGGLVSDGLTIFVSQSGRSAEVVSLASGSAGEKLALTNYAPSPLAEVCTQGLNLGNLSDSSVSFVTFSGTILALSMLADYWAGRNRRDYWKDVIRSSMDAVMDARSSLDDLSEMLAKAPSVDFVAPAAAISVAEEAALMFREGPRLMATGMETRQYLHGPMDAASAAAHVVFGGTREALLIDQLAEQTSNLAYITGQAGGTVKVPAFTQMLPVSVDDGPAFAIAATFVAQRLTLRVAELKGIDINEAVFVRLDTKTDRVVSAA